MIKLKKDKKDKVKFAFKLGDRARDKITGFEGIVTYRTQWLNNCNTYGVQPSELDKDGDVRKSVQFDEPQLELVEKEIFQSRQETGGPTDTVLRTNR